MQKWNYLLIVLFILTYLLEFSAVGRGGVRIVYADTWLSFLLQILVFALLIVSVKNLENVAGKLGVAILSAGLALQYALDFYFNG